MEDKARKGRFGLQVEISNMNREDLDEIIEIEKASFSIPWPRDAYEAELENKNSIYKVIRMDNKVVAYGGMWVIVDEAHITNIAVHPDYRGRGLGDKLLEEIIHLSKEHKVVGITLEVRPSNRAALGLYKKKGFIPSGIRKGYYTDTGEEAIIMWKYLSVSTAMAR